MSEEIQKVREKLQELRMELREGNLSGVEELKLRSEISNTERHLGDLHGVTKGEAEAIQERWGGKGILDFDLKEEVETGKFRVSYEQVEKVLSRKAWKQDPDGEEGDLI